MAEITADRVYETSTTTGTGSYTLAGAISGYRAFSAVCANGDTVRCFVEEVDANGVPNGGWEVGIYTWGTGGVLARTTIEASSNAGAAVSWSAGTRRIGLGVTASKIASLGGGGLANWTEAVNTATPNGTVPVVSFTATNAAANADAAFVPKGTGAFTVAVADNTTTGGNKRGDYSVDLQRVRSANTQVTSGTYSSILGGQNNTNSRNYSVIAGGDGNTINGSGSRNFIGGGGGNTASATYCGVIVGLNCVASGNYAVSSGNGATASGVAALAFGQELTADASFAKADGFGAITRGVYGAEARASGYRSAAGDVQRRSLILRRTTTDATATAMSSDGGAAGAANQLSVPTNGAFKVRGQVSVKRTNGQMAGWDFSCLIKNVSGTVSIVGTPVVTSIGSDTDPSTYVLALNADNTNKCLQIAVTGAAGHTAYWGCELVAMEVL